MAIFTGEGSVGKTMSWQIFPEEGKDHSVISADGSLAFAWSNPGQFLIILVVVKDNSHDIAIHPLHNGVAPPGPGPGPGPNPNPGPRPGPNPPIPPDPNDTWGYLESLTTQAVLDTVPQSRERSDLACKLAESFSSLVAAIDAGVFKDVKELRETTRDENRVILGDKSSTTWSRVNEVVGAQLKGYNDSGVLAELKDYKEAWAAQARGFKAAASVRTDDSP
jgi:hypothetical protein